MAVSYAAVTPSCVPHPRHSTEGADVLLLVVAVLTFAAGTVVGALLATRNAPRLVARLPQPERLAFARKVSQLARR